jgi:hypothetical protein
MMTESVSTAVAAAEPTSDVQIDEIIGRLERRYTGEQISHADLEGRVRGSYHAFDTAHIRTFVPVFVERRVRQSIDEQTAAHAA